MSQTRVRLVPVCPVCFEASLLQFAEKDEDTHTHAHKPIYNTHSTHTTHTAHTRTHSYTQHTQHTHYTHTRTHCTHSTHTHTHNTQNTQHRHTNPVKFVCSICIQYATSKRNQSHGGFLLYCKRRDYSSNCRRISHAVSNQRFCQ